MYAVEMIVVMHNGEPTNGKSDKHKKRGYEMKTPEELAEEYRDLLLQNGERVNVFDAFLAGYQAAKEEDKAKMQNLEANWKFCCEDKNRLMQELAATERALDQLADVSKVMNSSNNSNGWISVKERLPEDWEVCLWYASSQGEFDCGWENNECINLRCKTGCGQKFDVGAIFICEFHRKDKHYEQHYLIDDANNVALIDRFTHWMPLPLPPEE